MKNKEKNNFVGEFDQNVFNLNVRKQMPPPNQIHKKKKGRGSYRRREQNSVNFPENP